MNYKHIIFDFDGTLVNSLPDVCASLGVAFSRYFDEKIVLQENDVIQWIGHGMQAMIEGGLKSMGRPPDLVKPISEIFLEYYRNHPVDHSVLYPSVESVLNELRSKMDTMSICSNKPEVTLFKVMEAFKIGRFFDCVSGGNTFAVKKPDPDHLYLTCDFITEENKANCLFVGDSDVDIRTAKNAGIDSVFVTYGYLKDRPSSFSPTYEVHRFNELMDIIDR